MTLFLDKLLPQIVWEELPPEAAHNADPLVTHRGMLKVEDFELQCYRGPDGEVAFDIEDLERFFRGCHLCDHPSRCPACNPSSEERQCSRLGLIAADLVS